MAAAQVLYAGASVEVTLPAVGTSDSRELALFLARLFTMLEATEMTIRADQSISLKVLALDSESLSGVRERVDAVHRRLSEEFYEPAKKFAVSTTGPHLTPATAAEVAQLGDRLAALEEMACRSSP